MGGLGFLGISSILFLVVLTHTIGRIAGPVWIVLGLIVYWIYRRRVGLTFLGNYPHDWNREQIDVYRDAGEIGIMEEFEENLERRERLTHAHDGMAP